MHHTLLSAVLLLSLKIVPNEALSLSLSLSLFRHLGGLSFELRRRWRTQVGTGVYESRTGCMIA